MHPSCAKKCLRAFATRQGACDDGGRSCKGGRYDGRARGVAGCCEFAGDLGSRGCNCNGLGRLCALGLGTLGLGLAGLFLGFDLLGRYGERALGDSGVIGRVDHVVARADGLTRLAEDAAAEFFLVAIVNDLAACGRLDGSAFDLDGADRLAILAYGKSEDCRRVSSAVSLLRTIEILAGVMPS